MGAAPARALGEKGEARRPPCLVCWVHKHTCRDQRREEGMGWVTGGLHGAQFPAPAWLQAEEAPRHPALRKGPVIIRGKSPCLAFPSSQGARAASSPKYSKISNGLGTP